ncbi:hypothetical protein BJ741DRAFT_316883 [Chytriomyces cf. hyalinus JEL632]|nr:hypothetical protein BJ741DRAFT_316883 [Chytriomyces cf. hyalinus JEL632]
MLPFTFLIKSAVTCFPSKSGVAFDHVTLQKKMTDKPKREPSSLRRAPTVRKARGKGSGRVAASQPLPGQAPSQRRPMQQLQLQFRAWLRDSDNSDTATSTQSRHSSRLRMLVRKNGTRSSLADEVSQRDESPLCCGGSDAIDVLDSLPGSFTGEIVYAFLPRRDSLLDPVDGDVMCGVIPRHESLAGEDLARILPGLNDARRALDLEKESDRGSWDGLMEHTVYRSFFISLYKLTGDPRRRTMCQMVRIRNLMGGIVCVHPHLLEAVPM